MDVTKLHKFDPAEIGYNHVAKRKGLIRPQRSPEESIAYLNSETFKSLPLRSRLR